MQSDTPPVHLRLGGRLRRFRRGSMRMGVAVISLAALLAAAQQAPNGDGKPNVNSEINPGGMQAVKEPSSQVAGGATRKDGSQDAARLLQLATELKREVDKTNPNMLSINVIRKAEMIEKLAKGVKEKMKHDGGASQGRQGGSS